MNEIIGEKAEVKREVAVLWEELDVKKNQLILDAKTKFEEKWNE